MHANAGRKLCWGMVLGTVVVLLLCISAAAASSGTAPVPSGPVVYLNFDEGSGNLALDASGHGNTGTIHGDAFRVDNDGCVKALVLEGNASYVSIPYTPANHPADAITISLWFYVNDTTPQTLISTYYDGGGYRLAFDEGNDLFWTLGLDNPGGDISVVIPHENIALGQWHQVTGTYDGQISKIYLDGILRSQVNATGEIRYSDNNSIQICAEAGAAESPDQDAPRFLTGGIDEVRIYNRALSYGQVMDDHYQCTAAPGTGILSLPTSIPPAFLTSGTLTLGTGETVTKKLTFSNQVEEGTWHVYVPSGSQLTVGATDAYSEIYRDEWYVELKDRDTRLTRVVAFPVANNAPATGTIASGNATVLVHYFGGPARFPAGVRVTFTCANLEIPVSSLPKAILEYPIIVIYSASWATLVALVVVIVWAHKRRTRP
ncbi:MAG: LamG domain-containing protein [Methanoregula sp.]|uniref:LamG domain-containing protein n=1 Tax=Methanoregula sp. TaxID=2052170 RepID=UPI003BAFD21D